MAGVIRKFFGIPTKKKGGKMRILDNYSIESVKQKIDELTTNHCEDLKEICLELAQALSKNKKDPKYLDVPNISFSLVAPGDDREDEFAKQRMERGFDSSELWCLKSTISGFILPRLKAFTDDLVGYPGSLGGDEWKKILEKMIRAFEICKSDGEGYILKKKDYTEFYEGMELFKEYFFCLWY